MYNGTVLPQTEATLRYTQDHYPPLENGTQNVIVNTVGFALTDDRQQALDVLQETASNGGGSFYTADNPAQLEQALNEFVPTIAISAPLKFATVSGTAVPITAGVTNAQCVAGVQFQVDGTNISAEDTASPYSITWNSALVENGLHSITGLARDPSGGIMISRPVAVITSNDRVAPVVTGMNMAVGITSATISWTTDEASDTQVYYGSSTSYGFQTALDSSMVTSHSVTITGLTEGTQYYFQIRSKDSGGNPATLGLWFITEGTVQQGALDHFKITFYNNGAYQPGPGVKEGSLPYHLTAGGCFSTLIEAIDNLNHHFNLTSSITISQEIINAGGTTLDLAQGIALKNNFALGVASMSFVMTNGYVFLGTDTDTTQQLCFYKSSRAPLDYKQSGDLGDMQIKVVQVSSPSINGLSDSYVVWHGNANRIALLAPNQALAPATLDGYTGVVSTQTQGHPFTVSAYLTDRYWNQILNSYDELRFTSSVSTNTSFYPVEGTVSPVSGGMVASKVTVNVCGSSATLRAEDLTNIYVFSGQVNVGVWCSTYIAPGEKGFYELSVPQLVTACEPFPMTVTVRNLDLPAGGGDVQYSVRFRSMIPIDASRFTYSSATFGVPILQFTIPAGTSDYFSYTLPSQSYPKAETIWMQLIGYQKPPELDGASAIAGPMLVMPGEPSRLIASANPSTVGPLSASAISVTLTDKCGNGVSGADIAARVAQGSGSLGVLSGITNSAGMALFTFTGGRISETNIIQVRAPAYEQYIAPVNVVVSVSLLDADKIISAYPNPTRITQRPVTIEYRLPQDSQVKIKICDIFGNEVWKTSFEQGSTGGRSGSNSFSWDGKNSIGILSAVGMYAVHIEGYANSQRILSSKYRFALIK